MDLDLPHHLHSTRDVLAASLRLHPKETAPTAPKDLLDDLGRRFTLANPQPSMASKSWFERAQAFIASPSFGIAAAAMVVLSFATPSILDDRGNSQKEGIRGLGIGAASDQQLQVFLVKAPASVRTLIESSGDFEPDVVSNVEHLKTVMLIEGPRVIVDFNSGTISGFNQAGNEVYKTVVPEDTADLSLAITKAVNQL